MFVLLIPTISCMHLWGKMNPLCSRGTGHVWIQEYNNRNIPHLWVSQLALILHQVLWSRSSLVASSRNGDGHTNTSPRKSHCPFSSTKYCHLQLQIRRFREMHCPTWHYLDPPPTGCTVMLHCTARSAECPDEANE